MAILRSLLFLPANRADRFLKALASGADAVCLDLEDALPPADKEAGLASALELLTHDRGGVLVTVRANDVNTERGRQDLEALRAAPSPPDAVLLPKVTGPDDLARAARTLGSGGGRLLIPIVETALGLSRVEEIARTGSSLALALMLGGVDLTAELGAAFEWDSLFYARSRMVLAAALAGGLPTLDTPSLDVTDLAALEREARAVSRLGFTGKAAIHPAQLAAIHDAFRPSEAELERARRVVQAFEASAGGVVLVDGWMVDPPVVRAAQQTLERAERLR
ncbi:MAG: CoA ester lyase [Gemmatimonadetes bacterium]|nr:CoA ester lyase [Gemmatimonadota bacterium]